MGSKCLKNISHIFLLNYFHWLVNFFTFSYYKIQWSTSSWPIVWALLKIYSSSYLTAHVLDRNFHSFMIFFGKNSVMIISLKLWSIDTSWIRHVHVRYVSVSVSNTDTFVHTKLCHF
jgi:hypothetical protein